ncbi:protein of unknown function [Taphrina deformans PYCC 5710]|uniref:Uncharacterized protein n=1 Tax=Taphrina deformans (strain PYCC 5710 / ATCC 11124 / CBS 356.35 / IMI 108563 / JCM 9778 / NBRC 8474) TaxID=1097556 RepID=R4XHA1_TAPDE|nr:protein of unknown function [Taphrina deformans PYCC 5710]|eukprot:CCG83908.1 protein of unknown function [Taphrina deformans PYCC 5710]
MPDHYIYNDIENVHRTVYSISTADRAYFQIVLGLKSNAYNPNIIPHRTLNDTYIVVAQESEHSVEQLECVKAPSILPIAATFGDKCHDNLAYFGYNVGPHDARLFYGPTKPLVVYGSNSAYTCFGQFVQDFRLLLDWGFDWNIPKEFKSGTEIQRPGKYGPIEKNFFLFWDEEGDMYAHFDLIPSRSFAKLNDDGSVGKNLAPAAKDERCLSALMPAVAAESESVHQATNSLSITMCKRSDKHCEPNNKNTFVFTIFQHKSFYSFHSNYEPYVMIFSQAAPFSVQAISQKPIWIHGRGLPGTRPEWIPPEREWEQTEMFYITSMAWATQGQTYHGYLDDPLFLAFGIEDSKTGGIDILASNLFQDLAYCSAV